MLPLAVLVSAAPKVAGLGRSKGDGQGLGRPVGPVLKGRAGEALQGSPPRLIALQLLSLILSCPPRTQHTVFAGEIKMKICSPC